jgi:septal ring factor EnvC (AmiA/AmiB activator)
MGNDEDLCFFCDKPFDHKNEIPGMVMFHAECMNKESERLAQARAEIARLTQERDEARDWVRRLHSEAQVLTCVYCGHAYPPGTPASGSPALTEHINQCEKHPLTAVRAQLAASQRAHEETRAREKRLRDLLQSMPRRGGWVAGYEDEIARALDGGAKDGE